MNKYIIGTASLLFSTMAFSNGILVEGEVRKGCTYGNKFYEHGSVIMQADVKKICLINASDRTLKIGLPIGWYNYRKDNNYK